MHFIESLEELEKLYGIASPAATEKEIDYIDDIYRPFIECAPFAALATVANEGIDCSPRGDNAGFVRIADEKTLLMPDRRGNNRTDSLRNIIRDPRTSFMFLIPGSNTVLRVNGRAKVSIYPALLASFAVDGKEPRSVIVLTVERIYFQCARALIRSQMWDASVQVDPKFLPTPGQILAKLTKNQVGGEGYDKEWPERAKNSMW